MAKGIISFRPQDDTAGDLAMLKEWCEQNKSSVNTVFNSFLPAITYAVTRQTIKGEDGEVYIRADFGDILLRKFHSRSYSPADVE